jgi:hypothetical protein
MWKLATYTRPVVLVRRFKHRLCRPPFQAFHLVQRFLEIFAKSIASLGTHPIQIVIRVQDMALLFSQLHAGPQINQGKTNGRQILAHGRPHVLQDQTSSVTILNPTFFSKTNYIPVKK